MNEKQVLMILSILKANYGFWAKGLTNGDIDALVVLWLKQFEDYNPNVVANAVQAIIATDQSDYPPNIAKIKQMCNTLLNGNRMTEQEAWNYIKRALPNASVSSKTSWENFPKEVQELCTPRDLVQWACYTDEKQVDTVIASNFMRSYREKVSQNKQQELLPNSVKRSIIGIVESMKLENKGNDENE